MALLMPLSHDIQMVMYGQDNLAGGGGNGEKTTRGHFSPKASLLSAQKPFIEIVIDLLNIRTKYKIVEMENRRQEKCSVP